jgi:hypothetical protein
MDPVMGRLQLAAARYALGTARSEELCGLADSILSDGVYSHALGELDTLARPEMSEVGPLFQQALNEFGLSVPSREAAIVTLLRHHVGTIAVGNVLPEEGLRRVMQEVYFPANLYQESKEFVGDSHGLQHLIGCFYAYDDLRLETKLSVDAIKTLDRQVVTLAKEWLAEQGA